MSVRRPVLATLLFALLGAAIFAIACGGTTSGDTIPPITGIVIRSETLTVGRGCGRAPGQVFKFAAVAIGWNGSAPNKGPHDDTAAWHAPVTAAVYDCFADGTFVQLPPSPDANGSLTYRIELFVFDAPAYGTAQLDVANAVNGIVTGAGRDDALHKLRCGVQPTWTTTCTATQQQDVQVLAACDPLVFGVGGLAHVPDPDSCPSGPTAIELGTQAFAAAGGGIAACGDADGGVPEAGATPDAGDAGGGDAAGGDAATDGGNGGDAGAAVVATYRTVDVVASTPGAPAAAKSVACPATYHYEPAEQTAAFGLDVTLRAADGSRVGHTTCTASAEPGRTSSARCAPVTLP